MKINNNYKQAVDLMNDIWKLIIAKNDTILILKKICRTIIIQTSILFVCAIILYRFIYVHISTGNWIVFLLSFLLDIMCWIFIGAFINDFCKRKKQIKLTEVSIQKSYEDLEKLKKQYFSEFQGVNCFVVLEEED